MSNRIIQGGSAQVKDMRTNQAQQEQTPDTDNDKIKVLRIYQSKTENTKQMNYQPNLSNQGQGMRETHKNWHEQESNR